MISDFQYYQHQLSLGINVIPKIISPLNDLPISYEAYDHIVILLICHKKYTLAVLPRHVLYKIMAHVIEPAPDSSVKRAPSNASIWFTRLWIKHDPWARSFADNEFTNECKESQVTKSHGIKRRTIEASICWCIIRDDRRGSEVREKFAKMICGAAE